MDMPLNVVIVAARCSITKKVFGIRFEEQSPDHWICDWAFPITNEIAKNEGYDFGQVKGAIEMSYKYPGCPYCHCMSYMLCNTCKKVSCWNETSQESSCSWPTCTTHGTTRKVGGYITNLDGTVF